ncbi:alpha-1,6-mannosylglycoprotein 6-beta-N-acetylglucosaminyltransferase A-like isoform X2 [Hydra vulgaris]|uniref:alpha-1,6-mannosyl-glycoprotein 6-beta-N-acetylglucosaminyltransferase n=1 Tax=Hydra vulgaris TaxID=6087 RepID=A0ABM4DJZ6_HYDVU
MRFKPFRCLILAIFISISLFVIMLVNINTKTYKNEKEIFIEDLSNIKKFPAQSLKNEIATPKKNQSSVQSPDSCLVKDHQYFPLCNEKIQYLSQKDLPSCFSKVHGIDGTKCSIYNYLQNVKPFCANHVKRSSEVEYALPRYDLDGLLELLPENPYRWMRERAKQTWNDWLQAITQFNLTKQKWQKKKVLCFMGSMGFQPLILEMAGKGGPLGELVQWTDLISGLYVLGYDIRLHLNNSEFNKFMDADDANGCAQKKFEKNLVDIFYTDSNGFVITMQKLGFASSAKYRCMMRILDSFGTYPEFNYPSYPHKIPGGRSGWANQNLIPTQFLTLFPHTHDNSFLGFVVGNINSTENLSKKTKKNIALIYAKLSSYLAGRIAYLDVINEYFEIHATLVEINHPIPKYVINHGPVSGKKVKELLLQSKLFIGVGFPYEGPGPLEALAAGATYIQPKFDQPKDKFNEKFFEDKPTLRKLSSQSPYMEEMVGEPYSYTINVKNESSFRQILEMIKNREDLPPKIPKEFTSYGMLERIHIFTEHMDFCDATAPRWPPIQHIKVYMAERGQSCKDACFKKGLVCERTFFVDIDTKQSIERNGNLQCTKVSEVYALHAPSFDPITNICFVQSHGQLYSCMHEAENVKRLCPCRDFELEQVQLCKDCL